MWTETDHAVCKKFMAVCVNLYTVEYYMFEELTHARCKGDGSQIFQSELFVRLGDEADTLEVFHAAGMVARVQQ